MSPRRLDTGLSSLLCSRYVNFFALIIVFVGLCRPGFISAPGNATALLSTGSEPFSASLRKEYVVFSGNTTKQTQALRYSLQHILGAKNVVEYGSKYTGPQFWLVKMGYDQVARLMASIPSVSTWQKILITQT